MAKATATPKDVREWANLPTDTKGRLPKGLADEFTKATGRKVVAVKPHSTVNVKVKGTDKNGRAITKTRKVPTSEVRSLLGHADGRRGRFSAADLAEAGSRLAK
jgi:hypothetical protein